MNDGTSDYNSLQMLYQRRLSHGLQAMTAYTWSHSTDDNSLSAFGYPASVLLLLSSYRASSDFDIRHSLEAAASYDVPVPRWNRLTHAILGGWGTGLYFPCSLCDTGGPG
jgi:hypothetical protein